MYLAYSLLTFLGVLIVSPYFLYQAIRHKKYIGSLRQRLGYLPIAFNVGIGQAIPGAGSQPQPWPPLHDRGAPSIGNGELGDKPERPLA